jgi:hypothetical protein
MPDGERMMLTSPDEFFNHQVALPHAVVGSSDPTWRERYWVSLQDVADRRFILTLGLGKYPNQDVMEGFVIVQHGNVQRNLRVSRQLSPASDDMRVGPLRVSVVEPLKTIAFHIDDNPAGIRGEFTWLSGAPPILEERHFEVNRSRVSHDLVRYVQLGRIEGELAVAGERFALTREATWAERDHSWGMRPMPRLPGEPPQADPGWNFLVFCPIQFPSFSLHFYLFEVQPGRHIHLSATIVHADGRPGDAIRDLEHDFTWDDDAPIRTMTSGTVRLRFYDGRTLDVEMSALPLRVFLKGGGYGVDHGRWKGESHLEHEVWDLSDPVKLKDYVRGSSDHLVEARCNGEAGYGIIEYVVRAAHQAYGRRRQP